MPARRMAFSQIESKYTPGKGREYIWQDDAACEGSNPDDFQYLQSDDPGYRGISYLTKWGKAKVAGERESNRLKLEVAARTCTDCPVKKKCFEAASPAELFWSVRGGQMPTLFGKKLRQSPASDVKDYFPWECKLHGRTFMGMRYGGKGRETGKKYPYCTECTK